MKFVFPEINSVFDTAIDKINVLVIENSGLLTALLTDIQAQIDGEEGISVLSEADKHLSFGKAAELLTTFVPFDINKKTLLNKISNELEKSAAEADNYEKTMMILGKLESFLYDLTFPYRGDIEFTKLTIGNIIKAVGLQICDDYHNLAEKIIDYMLLVNEFEQQKLFITVNLRSFLSDQETADFFETVLSHGLHILMIENREYLRLTSEKRYIIDKDLCELT